MQPAPAASIYLATVAGLASLLAELALIVRRFDNLNPDEPWAPWPARIKRSLRALNDRKTITDAVLRRAFDLIVTFCAVGLLYTLLQFWIDNGFGKPSAERTVLWLEESAITLRSVNPVTAFVLKPPKWFDLLVTLALVLLVLSIPALARLSAWWKLGVKSVGRAYIALTLIASITFFRNQQATSINASTRRLHARIAKSLA